jgi:hypothetical protein
MRYSSAVAVSVALLPNLAVSQGYTNESEVPLYGLSPPVYPTRKCCDQRWDSSKLMIHSRRQWNDFICLGICIRSCERSRGPIDAGREVKSHTRCLWALCRPNGCCTSSPDSGAMLRGCTCRCARAGVCVIVSCWHSSWSHLRQRSDAPVRPCSR